MVLNPTPCFITDPSAPSPCLTCGAETITRLHLSVFNRSCSLLVTAVSLVTRTWSTMHEGRTGRKAASEEHVEEILRRDVSLEASVEFESSVCAVCRAAGLFSSAHVVLPPLLCVTQHCVRIPDLYRTTVMTTVRQEVKTVTQQQQIIPSLLHSLLPTAASEGMMSTISYISVHFLHSIIYTFLQTFFPSLFH